MKIVHRDNYKPLTTTYNKNDVIEAALNWSEVYKQVGRIDFIEGDQSGSFCRSMLCEICEKYRIYKSDEIGLIVISNAISWQIWYSKTGKETPARTKVISGHADTPSYRSTRIALDKAVCENLASTENESSVVLRELIEAALQWSLFMGRVQTLCLPEARLKEAIINYKRVYENSSS